MTAEEHIEALAELDRLKAEDKYIDYTNRKPSYDGETGIDERIY